MAAYLSPAWFAEVDEMAKAGMRLHPERAAGRLTIQQIVTGGASGEVRYWVRVDDGRVHFGTGAAEAPDATVTQSYETAAAISRGELGVEAAILAGRIRLSGDVGVLVQHQATLHGVAGAFEALRARTTYE